MRRHFSIWKTTILGGVFFLLPLGVVVFLLGQAVEVVYAAAKAIQHFVPDWSPGGISLAFLLAILLLLAVCYAAGLAARRSLASTFRGQVEKYLLLLFPRYAVIKDQVAGNLGGDLAQPSMKPVLVRFDEAARIGFETERSGDGPAATVAVYLPGSPDPWTGHVVHVSADRVAPFGADFPQTVAVCEAMGRGANRVISPAPTQPPA